jgi:sugar (pentulose or hexulose) kinase
MVSVFEQGRTALGIEFGSTRIKAVLIGPDHEVLGVGSHDWENQFVGRVWTYSLEAVWAGVRDCYAALAADVRQRHGVELTSVGALGVSAMMHGYLAFDAEDQLLVPFRTWEKVLGVGDASGMFPIDVATGGYDVGMSARFDELTGLRLADLLPGIKRAGEPAGRLTEAVGPGRPVAAGCGGVPAGGGRRDGDGGDELGGAADWERVGGDQHFRDGGVGTAAEPGVSGGGSGDHPGGGSGGDGALQQRGQ